MFELSDYISDETTQRMIKDVGVFQKVESIASKIEEVFEGKDEHLEKTYHFNDLLDASGKSLITFKFEKEDDRIFLVLGYRSPEDKYMSKRIFKETSGEYFGVIMNAKEFLEEMIKEE